jgi:5-methylcytosine-specific restriction endonuclease McrA
MKLCTKCGQPGEFYNDKYAKDGLTRQCKACQLARAAADLPLTVDHVVAISRGGGHTAENVVPACRSDNCRKHDLPVFVMVRRTIRHVLRAQAI